MTGVAGSADGYNVIVVDGLASLVIGLTSFICSLGLATIPWLALSRNAPEGGEGEAEYRAWLGLLSGAAFVVSAFVLQSFGGKSRDHC